jgi:hypothetical protein
MYDLSMLSSFSDVESIGASTPLWGGHQNQKEAPMEKLTRLFGRSIRFAYHCFDRIDPRLIQERLDYWTFMLGPKFAKHERDGMDLRRYYFISQVEYAQNIIFKRNNPIHSIFERSCDLGLARFTTARIANIFGWRITKRTKGKHQVVLDQMDHGHHVLRLPLSRQGFRVQAGSGTRLQVLSPEPCHLNPAAYSPLRSMSASLTRKLRT